MATYFVGTGSKTGIIFKGKTIGINDVTQFVNKLPKVDDLNEVGVWINEDNEVYLETIETYDSDICRIEALRSQYPDEECFYRADICDLEVYMGVLLDNMSVDKALFRAIRGLEAGQGASFLINKDTLIQVHTVNGEYVK